MEDSGARLAACLRGIALALACALALPAAAQPYPSKPIRFVVNASPGGSPDIISRIVGQKLTENLGQQVVVDTRPGGGGVIAGELVARAAPDGYTVLLAGAAVFGALPVMRKKLPFDPFSDFAPVTLVAETANVVVVTAALPPKSVAELIQYARAKPLFVASSGVGTPAHLAAELFNVMAGLKNTTVQYKGAGPAITDLMAGEVQLFITSPVTAMPWVATGKLRALATTGARRSPAFPAMPTVAETIPGYVITQWWGMVVPARTSVAVQEKLNQETVRALEAPEVRERFASQGAVARGSTPQELARFMKTEHARTLRIIKQAGIAVDH